MKDLENSKKVNDNQKNIESKINLESPLIEPLSDRSYSCCGSTSTSEKSSQEIIDETAVRKEVRNQYRSIATKTHKSEDIGSEILKQNIEESDYTWYSEEELDSIPQGANLGLGSGNPVKLASVQPGEVVVDLGSGAGVDVFLASKKTGNNGKVIGVDMTPEMIDKARNNARSGNYDNVEFRLGEIEHLPIADNTADLIISNCVINLSVDKSQVFRDAYRVLKPGGRLVISDIILEKELPKVVRDAIQNVPGCLTRSQTEQEYLSLIESAGFANVEILDKMILSPRDPQNKKLSEENFEGTRKARVILDGEPIEIDISSEEIKELSTSISAANIRATKSKIGS
ncbi:MAG: arsenite methyltransferase [Candidatus Heimdallarchaeota archaeon]